jgi:hypothetical protein
MPRKAQHIERQWLADAMSQHPGGRKAVSEATGIPLNLLSEYVTGARKPRPGRAIVLGKLLGFDGLRCFFAADSTVGERHS